MASNIDFIEFVCSQLEGIGTIRHRKMFGEYMIYINEKPVVLICDNIAYIKKHPAIAEMMQEAETGFPYDGAKEHYILDVEHKHPLMEVISALEKVLPYPKMKGKKSNSKNNIHPFRELPNVGTQTEKDLLTLEYTSIESLQGKKADDLYQEECRLRGCIIDRCQLYLYRALEYYINTENPDKDKSKWWYWKDDYFYPSPCGARCVECTAFPKSCKGCRKIKGKVFWIQYTGDDQCPIWKCCKENKRINCGECKELPCSRFMKDPSISEEENERNLMKMIDNLKKTEKEFIMAKEIINDKTNPSKRLTPQYKIHPLKEKDIPEMQNLFRTTVLNINIQHYTKEEVEDWASCGDDPARWKELLSHNQYIGAFDENDCLIGFSSMNKEGYLHSMFVHKDWQGKGVATQLLFEIETLAQQFNVTDITSEVSLTARPFFEKKGYKVIKSQKAKANKLKLTNFVMHKSLKKE